ncbi:ATP/GTP-binding protein [Niastella koreensis]|uniref:ATP/GTP-binding protein n=2 Tax=Niastella koreensis TaxID=354356 RepID=G8TPT0_NIAKG|nr:ATP/GTP-binding protein [Niastella koreensis]AEV98913.1 ATP/GTP-binding protein [Niastella koreensis GR20-10]OQP43838.1 ATP/GTP-binding protein [Niastella koreensis]
MKKHLITAAFILTTTLVNAQEHQLVKKWETDTLLKVPESALYDAENKIIYVTNIDGQPWEKDNKGSVGKVGLDGKIITVDWVTGFNAPKGMGLYKNNLYVADVDKVGVIDIKKGQLIQTIPVTGAEGLNDLTVDKKGVVYVSDSKTKKIHRIENGQVSTWLENLKGPNGVLIHDDNLYILDAGGLYKVEKDKTLTKLADGMEASTDGLEHVTGKDYLVSCWIGTVYYVKGDGTKQLLLDTREQKSNTADIGYDPKNRIVYVPTFFKNKIVAYELK